MHADEYELIDEIQLDVPLFAKLSVDNDRLERVNLDVALDVMTRGRILCVQTAHQQLGNKGSRHFAGCEQVPFRDRTSNFMSDVQITRKSLDRSIPCFAETKWLRSASSAFG